MKDSLAWALSGTAAAVMTALSLLLMAAVNAPHEPVHHHEASSKRPIELVHVEARPLPQRRYADEPLVTLSQANLPSLPAPQLDTLSAPRFNDRHVVGHAQGVQNLGLGQLDLGQLTMSSGADSIDRSAQPKQRPAPRYPIAARRKGQEGYVVLRFTVDANGRVTDVIVVESEPAGVFDSAAKQAARRYRFEPARSKGKNVASTLEQKVVFRLQ